MSDPIYYIYKITNTVNGKAYIGFTSKTPSQRWKNHKRNAAAGSVYALHAAIRKYHDDSFSIETIYCSTDRHTTLKEMEPYFIRLYNTNYRDGFGYNMTPGGEGIGPLSEKTKQKIAQSHFGKRASTETKTLLSKQRTGRKQSPETCKKRSEALKGQSRPDLLGRRGFKHSQASKDKMSNALRKAWLRRNTIRAQPRGLSA